MAAEEMKTLALEPPFDTFIFDLDGTLLDTLDDLIDRKSTRLNSSHWS